MDSNLSFRLKKRRLEIGLSLRELARRTELSAQFLSQVEHGKANMSLDSLQKIADSLEVPLFYFLSESERIEENQEELSKDKYYNAEEPELYAGHDDHEDGDYQEYTPLVRVDSRPKLILPLTGVKYEMLVPSLSHQMEALCGRLAPGTGNVARRFRQPTEEFIYLLSGVLKVGLDIGEYILKPGDTIYFEGYQLQTLCCASDTEEAVWLSVITPPQM